MIGRRNPSDFYQWLDIDGRAVGQSTYNTEYLSTLP